MESEGTYFHDENDAKPFTALLVEGAWVSGSGVDGKNGMDSHLIKSLHDKSRKKTYILTVRALSLQGLLSFG
ncbi:MAG: hypothetical protein JRC91_11085 [Deltaproteobacteria bacterium]|nr:hypothetical protein [Deltaproteobacteria bacterium]